LLAPSRESSALRASGAACPFVAFALFCTEPGQAAPLAIEPMTVVNVQAQTGYFQDPYPVHKAPANSPDIQVISGTTPGLLSGAYPLGFSDFLPKPVIEDQLFEVLGNHLKLSWIYASQTSSKSIE
jgi:hypothetical protein